jgi:hypothetical protein
MHHHFCLKMFSSVGKSTLHFSFHEDIPSDRTPCKAPRPLLRLHSEETWAQELIFQVIYREAHQTALLSHELARAETAAIKIAIRLVGGVTQIGCLASVRPRVQTSVPPKKLKQNKL